MTLADAVATIAAEFKCDVRDVEAVLTAFLREKDAQGSRQWVDLARAKLAGKTMKVEADMKGGSCSQISVVRMGIGQVGA